jgi:hypothetical protein
MCPPTRSVRMHEDADMDDQALTLHWRGVLSSSSSGDIGLIQVVDCRLHPGEAVPIGSYGELKREDSENAKLTWSPSLGREEMPLLAISTLLRDRTSDYLNPVLELRAAVSMPTGQFLIADRYANDIWYIQRPLHARARRAWSGLGILPRVFCSSKSEPLLMGNG